MFKVLLILFALSLSVASYGDDGGELRDHLIKKFQRIYLRLSPSDSSHISVTLRLADLLSERARVESLKELDSGCVQCMAGINDRKQALKYYNQVINKLPNSQRLKVLTQVGHLYDLLGRRDKAIPFYTQIIKDAQNAALVSEAHLSLAEMYFKDRNFGKALKQYEASLKSKAPSRKGLATYRKAWCMFHLGHTKQAIQVLIHILDTPNLLSRGSSEIVSIDEQFQEEVSHDLATFYAKVAVTLKDAKLVYAKSTAKTRLENVSYLASELERMGQLKPSLEVWKFVQAQQSDPVKRLEGHVRMAQLERQTNNIEASLEQFFSALSLWKQLDCQGNSCNELHMRLRKYVLDWNHEEKKKPSPELLSAYKEYISIYPEMDMTVWSLEVSKKQKNWSEALDLVKLAQKRVLLESEKALKLKISHEGLLIQQMELAELSKNKQWIKDSYDHYLRHTKKKSKWIPVHYQKAQLIYSQGDYPQAALDFKKIALMGELGFKKLKKQAADLALDSLVLAKDDIQIESWSSEFADRFVESASEFKKMGRKSVMNQSSQLAKSAEFTGAWLMLAKFDLSSASQGERILYYKNKLVLAEKLKKYSEARSSADQLLLFKGLSREDREFALSRKAWLAELSLDFKTALSSTRKMKLKQLTSQQRLLKLAVFSDLAGQNSQNYYKKYLKLHKKSDEQSRAIAAKLIRNSKNKLKTLGRYRKLIMEDMELFGRLHLEIFLESKQFAPVKKALKNKAFLATKAGQVLWREAYLKQFEKVNQKIGAHKVNSKTQRKLSRSLKRRVKLLGQLEGYVKRAINSGDWTAQVVSMSALANESDRFYSEIMSLPVPEELTPEQEQEYMVLISDQASPHKTKANDLRSKVKEFWLRDELFVKMEEQIKSLPSIEQSHMKNELVVLRSYASTEDQEKIQVLLNIKAKPEEKVDMGAFHSARRSVIENPFGVEALKLLLGFEQTMGRGEMVSYLRARIEKANANTEGGKNE